jgi:hypothetical protein
LSEGCILLSHRIAVGCVFLLVVGGTFSCSLKSLVLAVHVKLSSMFDFFPEDSLVSKTDFEVVNIDC